MYSKLDADAIKLATNVIKLDADAIKLATNAIKLDAYLFTVDVLKCRHLRNLFYALGF
jgi:hypothetical protein